MQGSDYDIAIAIQNNLLMLFRFVEPFIKCRNSNNFVYNAIDAEATK